VLKIKCFYLLTSACLLVSNFAIAHESECGILFRISLQNNTGTVYLVGSSHGAYEAPPSKLIECYQKLAGSADGLYLELLPRPPLEALEMISNSASLPSGQNIREIFGDKLYDEAIRALGARLGDVNVANFGFFRFKSTVLITTLEAVCASQSAPKQRYASIDEVLMNEAKGRNLMVQELEGYPPIVRQYEGLADQRKKLYLQHLVRQCEDEKALLVEANLSKKLLNAVLSGKSNYVVQEHRNFYKSNPQVAEVYEHTIFGRNKSLTELVKAQFKTGKKYIIGVGALHVGGNQGIVARLNREGFTTLQIMSADEIVPASKEN
jgi:uncharacterized protein YbaP (TraB family)